MIANLKPYAAYKDSGVPWIGQVPEHWEVLPNRALFSGVRDRDCPAEEMLSVTITMGVLRQKDLLADSSKKDSSNVDKSAYKLVQPGDIVYNKMRAWQGAVGLSAYRGIVSPAYVVQRPRGKVQPRYFHYLLRTPAFAKEAERWSFGITSDMWSLRPEHFKMIYGCRPPIHEQSAIIRFLDHADRRIQRYIRAKKKLIALLNEQRQTIIHRAVTRGLDPNARLKASGMDWLGQVPEHWTVRKLGQIAVVFNGTTPSRIKPAYWQGGTIPWLASGKVNDYLVETPSEFVTERAAQECSISLVPKGSVILGLVGQGRTRGMSALLGIDACINQNLAAIVPRRGIDGRYLHHLLTALYKVIREIGRGGNQEALNCDLVARLRLPFPPLSEQVALCEHLNSSLANIMYANRHAEGEIKLLNQYRVRLIADVVTGKLDAREAARRLPEEDEQAEPIKGEALGEANEAEIADFDAEPQEAVA